MTPPPHDPTEAWYFNLMRGHHRGLTRHWPLRLAALPAAVVIGVLSSDRSHGEQRPQATSPSVAHWTDIHG